MKFQVFHVNPGEKLKKKDVNNDLSNFMSVFPTDDFENFANTKHFYGKTWTNLQPQVKKSSSIMRVHLTLQK